jgi:hypothetical protein
MSVKVSLVNKLLVVSVLTASLSGCVVAIDGKTSQQSESGWKSSQANNLKHINQLQLGVASDEIRTLLGTPDFSELFEKDGEQVLVLFYRTHHVKSDGLTTKDECTPLVFKNNQLTGWGDKAYKYL